MRKLMTTVGLMLLAGVAVACGFFAGPEPRPDQTQQSPLPTTTSTPPPAPTIRPTPPFCIHHTHDCVVLTVLGYAHNGDGSTTIHYRITNNCTDQIAYVAIETSRQPRVAPQAGETVTGRLGDYSVSWTEATDISGFRFTGIRFDSQIAAFKAGAFDDFAVTVTDFNKRLPIAILAKSGDLDLFFKIVLYDPACEMGVDPTPWPTGTFTPVPFSPLPTPTPTPEGGVSLPTEPVVPACIFAPPSSGIPDLPIIPLSAYSFSKPQLVDAGPGPIEIHQWLPDNETILLQRHTGKGSAVELVNTQTKQITNLVGPDQSFKNPRWLSQDKTLVWSASSTPNRDSGYWVQSFEPYWEKRLTSESGWSYHDISPDGKKFVFVGRPGGTRPFLWNQENKTLSALPIDLANWRYKKWPNYPLQPFSPLWHPDRDKILFWDGTWAFLYNIVTNSGCEIDMNSISPTAPALNEVSWSPNGRYLLMIVGREPLGTLPRSPAIMLKLDSYTGQVDEYPQGMIGSNPSWSPDNQTVVLKGSTGQKINIPAVGTINGDGLYLLNVLNGEYQQILPE